MAMLLGAALAHGSSAFPQTPEQEKNWAEQRAQQLAEQKANADRLQQQRAARKADPMGWVRTLQPLTVGGWQFRAVAPDGSWAAFSTDHQMKRSGHLITVWLRQEYPEAQHGGNNGASYMSEVEKIQYDCANERGRALLSIYYSENNIGGAQQSEESDPKTAPWDPIVPGTQSEYLYQWACSEAGKAH